jgi:hypothetical protein
MGISYRGHVRGEEVMRGSIDIRRRRRHKISRLGIPDWVCSASGRCLRPRALAEEVSWYEYIAQWRLRLIWSTSGQMVHFIRSAASFHGAREPDGNETSSGGEVLGVCERCV